VRSVDRKNVGDGTPGPITKALRQAFFGLFDGRTEDRWNWLNVVSDRENQEPAVRGRTPQEQPASTGANA
jgi:branched-chain amino acid aminotransferase